MAKPSATKTSVTKANPAYEATVVDSTKLKRTKVWGETDKAVNWEGAFAVYGGNGTTASSTIVYEVEPGKRLGCTPTPPRKPSTSSPGRASSISRTDRSIWSGPGSVFVLPTPMRHDLENTGKETLRAVAFFAAAMFTQDFDQVMLPPKSHILGTPNRAG